MPEPAFIDRPLTFDVTARNGGVRVLLRGALDIAGAARLDDELHGFPPGDAVLLDVREVSFIDSTGLRALLEAGRAVDGDGSPVTLIGVSPAIERLLDLTGAGSARQGAEGLELLRRFTGGGA